MCYVRFHILIIYSKLYWLLRCCRWMCQL